MITWISLLAYPIQAHYSMPLTVQEDLDILQELLPIVNKGSRYTTMSDWLEMAMYVGLITPLEHSELRFAIAPEL